MTWYPAAEKVEGENAGNFLRKPAKCGVLHTTEGSSVEGAISAYRATRSWPHFTVGTDGRVVQHIPVDKAARALQNLSGGVETNRQGPIQIEVVAFAKNPNWPAAQVEALRALMRWVEATCGVVPRGPQFGSSEQYGQRNPFEFTYEQWVAFDGWCGHQHVPENAHWDPGAINLQVLLPDATPASAPQPVPVPAPPVDWTKEAIVALPTLSQGAKGYQVKIMQALLTVHASGFVPNGFVDGDFGPITFRVLRDWQARTGKLVADGICGPATWTWLIGA